MCGIAGVVSSVGAIEPGLIHRMCTALEHRGPDSRGFFEEAGVALGAARLAVIDLEGGDQPIFNEDRSVLVVCNGEIYNYRELRRELVRKGHRLGTNSDAEVIVHLYEELGADCVQPLRGMYAFAIWDRPARQLLLARDRVGKKPLFYADRGSRLMFASEPRAILADGEVPREVDPLAIDLFLHYQAVPSPRSAFSAIRKLRAAHTLTWRDGASRSRRYWKLSYRDRYGQAAVEEAAGLIRDALLEATHLRLRSDVPVGALLSGGVDSSAVVAAMARQANRPLKTFSIGFAVGEFDESIYAREVAQAYATEHHELVLDATAMELLSRYFDADARVALYEPEFRDTLDKDAWRTVLEEPYLASDASDPVERLLDVDVQTYLGEDLLVKMDIATMAHSLEARSPLCDQHVLELAAGLPMTLKLSGSTTKAIFKQAVRSWLPPSILDRPKMGFRIPVAEWLRGGIAAEVLLDPRGLSRGLFREDRVRTLVREHENGQGNHEYRIWTLLMLELWFRTYVDQPICNGPLTLSVC